MMMVHQLMLLLLLLFVNLPSCWSACDISAARRCAFVDQSCDRMKRSDKLAEDVSSAAAVKAGVLEPYVVEAYYDGAAKTTCLLFRAWSNQCISQVGITLLITSLSTVRASEKMFNYREYEVDHVDFCMSVSDNTMHCYLLLFILYFVVLTPQVKHVL